MDRETRKRLREAAERRRASGEPPLDAPPPDAPLENTLQPPGDDGVGFAVPSEIDCPFCAERIKAQAKVCKHCGRDLDEKLGKKRPAERASSVVHHHHHAAGGVVKNPGIAAVLAFFWPGVGHIYAGQIAFGLAFFVGWPVIVFIALYAGLLSFVAKDRGAGMLVALLVVGCAYVFQIYDAYHAASRPDRPARAKRRRR